MINSERHFKLMREALERAKKAMENIAKLKARKKSTTLEEEYLKAYADMIREKTPDYFWDDEASVKAREDLKNAMNNGKSYWSYKAGQAQQSKMKADFHEHLRKKPHFTFSEETQEQMRKDTGPTGPYGTIYGTRPSDWVQTKPPDPRKKIDLKKCKWKVVQFGIFNGSIYSLEELI